MEMMLMMNTAKLGNRMSREGIFYLAGRNPGDGHGGKSIVLPSDLEQNDIWGSLSKMLFDFCFEILVNPLQAQTCFFFFKPWFAMERLCCSYNAGRKNPERKNFLVGNPAKVMIFKISLRTKKQFLLSPSLLRGETLPASYFFAIFAPETMYAWIVLELYLNHAQIMFGLCLKLGDTFSL